MLTKYHNKPDLFSTIRSMVGRKASGTLKLINDRYNTFIEKFFLDDDVVIEKLTDNRIECGATLEWNYTTNESDLTMNIDENHDEDANLITRIRRSVHLYMELDTLDPEENYNSSSQPIKKLVVKEPGSSNKNNMRLFRLSRWNIIRFYFRNVFKAIENAGRKVKTFFIDGIFMARIYIPHTICEMKIRGPSKRC